MTRTSKGQNVIVLRKILFKLINNTVLTIDPLSLKFEKSLVWIRREGIRFTFIPSPWWGKPRVLDGIKTPSWHLKSMQSGFTPWVRPRGERDGSLDLFGTKVQIIDYRAKGYLVFSLSRQQGNNDTDSTGYSSDRYFPESPLRDEGQRV